MEPAQQGRPPRAPAVRAGGLRGDGRVRGLAVPGGGLAALDLSALGLGQQSVPFVLTALLVNATMHCGEISCLKGLQGLKGYPF